VTLFESESTCGGHTLTDDSSGYPVDLGFQVYNLTTYPNMVAFMEALGVDTEPSEMSFALSVNGGALEWGSHSLDTIFAQRGNLLSPSFHAMVRDVVRFGRQAPRVLDPAVHAKYSPMTLGQYLKEESYSKGFIDHYVLPMCAAVWSVPAAKVLRFPVTMLVRFWVNHHLLDLTGRPVWRVVAGRSRQYVLKVLQGELSCLCFFFTEYEELLFSNSVQCTSLVRPSHPPHICTSLKVYFSHFSTTTSF
jgi:predicted NAD/FAD-binding protein